MMALHDKSILIADDNENDLCLLLLALEKAWINYPIKVVGDGSQAIDYLAGHGLYSDRAKYPFPSLMLLDINMPIVNGFDVLAWTQKWGQAPDLPIIVLSGSPLPEDIERAKSLGATAYRVKRADDPTGSKLACEIRDFWLAPHRAEAESATAKVEFFHVH